MVVLFGGDWHAVTQRAAIIAGCCVLTHLAFEPRLLLGCERQACLVYVKGRSNSFACGVPQLLATASYSCMSRRCYGLLVTHRVPDAE
jgi:hypothetical protein